MKKIILFICIALLVFPLFACSSGTGGNSGNTDVENSANTNQAGGEEETSPTENSADTSDTKETSLSMDESLLEAVMNVPEGGYSFRPAKGCDVMTDSGITFMSPPGADPDSGPMIQIMGMISDTPTTLEDLYNQLMGGTDMAVSEPDHVTIFGYPGWLMSLTGDTGKMGKILLVAAGDYQQLMVMGGAPQADWESFEPYVDAVMASIEFTSVEAIAAINNLSPGIYAYTNRNVVRDITATQEVVFAATLGGLTMWKVDNLSPFSQFVPFSGMGNVSANALTTCSIPEPRVIVGTLQGVHVYNPDSNSWEDSSLFPADGPLANMRVERLYCDQANNRLLIGGYGLTVMDLGSGDMEQFNDQNGFLWNTITDITVKNKDIWVATGYKGIAKISGSQVTTYTIDNGLPDNTANAVEFGTDGTLWVGASSGLISFKNNAWKLYGSDTPANLYSINEIALSADKTLWVATAPLGAGRLCLFDIASSSCILEYTALENAPILALATDEAFTPYFGGTYGMAMVQDVTSVPLLMPDALVSNFVDSLTVSPGGKLWVGTDGGINIIDTIDPDENWTTYVQSEQTGMGGNWASDIDFAPDGSAWISVINGSATHTGSSDWTSFPDVYSYYAVMVEKQGSIWFADDGKGIIILDDNGNLVKTLTTADGLPSDNVQALLMDNDGIVWIGTSSGLAKYENGSLSVVFSDNSQIPNAYIRALALDPDGNLLIGTFTGVALYNGRDVEILVDFLKDGYSDARLTNLACTSTGEVWVGTDKGLLHKTNGGWEMMNTSNGLLSNYVSALAVDLFDTIWVGGGGSNFDGGGLVHIVP